MKISRLTTENFRGLKSCSLHFHDQLNVFVGENGSGKSSILEALLVSIGEFFYNTRRLTDLYSLKELLLFINNQAEHTVVKAEMDTFSIELGLHSLNDDLDRAVDIRRLKSSEEDQAHKRYSQSINDAKSQTDIFCYFPTTRHASGQLVNQAFNVSAKNKKSITNRLGKEILLQPSSSLIFSEFLGWIRLREDIENEKMRDERNHNDIELRAVKKAIGYFLNVNDLRISRNPNRLRVKRGQDWYDIKQLSDGERGLLCLIGDIARRLAIANPPLQNPLEGNGIILIDEIELHLHPNWQRMIVPKLLETFPNCQFFITTHSPQVLSEVRDPESVWRMKQSMVPHHPDQVYGLDSNEILTEILNAENKPTELTKALAEIDVLMNDEKYDEAREKMKKLAKQTRGSVPALVGANTMLTMMGEEQVDFEEVSYATNP